MNIIHDILHARKRMPVRDDRMFLRAFRRIVGMTPAEYRRRRDIEKCVICILRGHVFQGGIIIPGTSLINKEKKYEG